jgi:hypothetical protein
MTYRRPIRKTADTTHFLRVGMLRLQMTVCGIITSTRSEAVLMAEAAMLTALLSMQCPVLIVGSQALFRGLHMKISTKVQTT